MPSRAKTETWCGLNGHEAFPPALSSLGGGVSMLKDLILAFQEF